MPLRFWKRHRSKSVHQDWRSELPSEKSQVFAYALAQAEPAHVIFSMTLDEALMLRRSGKLEMARIHVELSAELCVRFAAALECLLTVVERHAHTFGLLPSVKPLDPVFFVGETAKRAAAMNSLLSTVLFKQSTCFLHKVRTLGEIAAKIADEYRMITAEVSEGDPSKQEWDQLSSMQDDLTTSLSEAAVMLKSFIISLPTAQVLAFRDRLSIAIAESQTPTLRAPKRAPLCSAQAHAVTALAVNDRRAAAFRRE